MSLYVQGHLSVMQGLAYEETLVGTSAMRLSGTGLPVPKSNCRRVVVQPADGTIRWKAVKGEDPTAAEGFQLATNEFLVYDGDYEDLSFIRDSMQSGDVTIRVHYFGA